MKRVFLSLAGILVALFIAVGIYYFIDSSDRIDSLRTGGSLIETDVGLVEYRLTGSGSGGVLLFFHGTPGGYDQGIGASAANRVLTLSRPGYLGTPLAAGATPSAQAEVAAALLDALEIDKVAVMGASGGGPAAYSFAAAYPQRTVGLVAMEAISHSMPENELGLPESDLLAWLMIQSLVSTQDDAGVVAQIAQNESDRELLAQQPAQQAQVAGMIWSIWPPSLRKTGYDNDFAQFQDLNLPLESIRVPTLVVHGTQDRAVPFVHAEYAVDRVPGAKLHAIEGAGHMMPFAHEVEVNGVVTAFFADHAER